MSEEKAGIWLRCGNLIYKLRHKAWHKGTETFENDVWISVQGHPSIPDEQLAKLADLIEDFLKTTESKVESTKLGGD